MHAHTAAQPATCKISPLLLASVTVRVNQYKLAAVASSMPHFISRSRNPAELANLGRVGGASASSAKPGKLSEPSSPQHAERPLALASATLPTIIPKPPAASMPAAACR